MPKYEIELDEDDFNKIKEKYNTTFDEIEGDIWH